MLMIWHSAKFKFKNFEVLTLSDVPDFDATTPSQKFELFLIAKIHLFSEVILSNIFCIINFIVDVTTISRNESKQKLLS